MKILIVGAFPSKDSKIIGGQITACKNLFPESLYEKENVIRFDTTQRSNPPPRILKRIIFSFLRFPNFLNKIIFNNPFKVIILITSVNILNICFFSIVYFYMIVNKYLIFFFHIIMYIYLLILHIYIL